MRSNLAKAFVVFEVIISIVVSNISLVLLSIVSFGVLLPVLLVSTMNYIKRMLTYKEYEGIVFTYFSYIKGNIGNSFKAITPIILVIILLLLNLFSFNSILIEYFPLIMVQIIFYIQLFIVYYLIGFLLHVSIILTNNKKLTLKEIYFNSFLKMNLNPIRNFFGILSLFISIYLSLYLVSYAYLIFIPIGLLVFYIIVSPIIKEHISNQGN